MRCDNCGGEDCVCCEVYQEQRAERYPEEYYGDEYYESVQYLSRDDEEEWQ